MNVVIRVAVLAVLLIGMQTLAPVSRAALVAYDGFDYTAGSYAGAGQASLNGGTGWANNWSGGGTISINAPTLQYGPFLNGANLLVNGNRSGGLSGGVSRTTSSEISGAGQTFWISLLLSSPGANSNLYLLETSSSDFLGFSLSSNNSAGGGSIHLLSNNTTPPASNFILLKLVFNGDNTSVNYTGWLNPTANTEAGLGPGTTGSKGAGAWNLDRVLFANDGGTQWDEIRIGTTFNDVVALVPEPSSLLLLSLGSAWLFRWRKRRV